MKLSQTQRIEMALPARFMLTVVVGGLKPSTHEEAIFADRLKGLFARACLEPLQGFNAATRAFVSKKIEKVHEKAGLAFMMRDPAKDGLVSYYLLEEHLLKPGRINLHEGSDFAEGMRLALPLLDHAFAEAKLDASAQKQAKKLFEYLQELGFYRDVPSTPSDS